MTRSPELPTSPTGRSARTRLAPVYRRRRTVAVAAAILLGLVIGYLALGRGPGEPPAVRLSDQSVVYPTSPARVLTSGGPRSGAAHAPEPKPDLEWAAEPLPECLIDPSLRIGQEQKFHHSVLLDNCVPRGG